MILTSITLDLFSGKNRPVISIPVPVVSLKDYHNKLSCFAKNRTSALEATINNQSNIVCREIFQVDKKEIFFFPSSYGTNVSLKDSFYERLFFLKGVYDWSFILIFFPKKHSKYLVYPKPSLFSQKDQYPEGANSANLFSFSTYCASILVSKHGCIAKDVKGDLFLQGITVSLLQTLNHKYKSVFVQKRDIFASLRSPLREEDLSSLEPRTCKFIKISCFCRQKDFSYSTHFPVLTSEEVQKKLNKHKERCLQKYGASFMSHRGFDTKQTVTKAESSQPLLIVVHPAIEADVPFGSCCEGKLFFSYSDESSLTLQLLFLPYLGDLIQPRQRKKNPRQAAQNWYIENSNSLIKCRKVTFATLLSFPCVKLVPSSNSEYIMTGMKVELVSSPRGNYWGVFCSPEKKISLFASSLKSTEPINTAEREMLLDSPTPGPSGLGYIDPTASLAQSASTVFASLEKKSQQTQQKGKSGRIASKISGRSSYAYGSSFPSYPRPRATVAVSPERQGKQTQKRRNFIPGPSSVRQHPYPYGPLPFCEGRFSIIPHSQAAATVSVPPGRQESQQTQQRSNSPVPGPSGGSFYPYSQYGPCPFSGDPYPYFYPEAGSFVEGCYSYGSSLPPYPHPSATQNQWMPVFPSSSSARLPVAALELLRYDIPGQEGVRNSGRAEKASAAVPVGAVQQISIWKPYEASSSAENFDEGAEVPPQAQAKNSDEDTDIDVEN